MCTDLKFSNPDAPYGDYAACCCACGRFRGYATLVGGIFDTTIVGGFVEYRTIGPPRRMWTVHDTSGRGPMPGATGSDATKLVADLIAANDGRAIR